MMSYEKELFNDVIYVAAANLSPNDAADLFEWVESLEVAKLKADEYEAKAKALDRIVEQRKKTGVITLGHHAWKIIEEYETGEK